MFVVVIVRSFLCFPIEFVGDHKRKCPIPLLDMIGYVQDTGERTLVTLKFMLELSLEGSFILEVPEETKSEENIIVSFSHDHINNLMFDMVTKSFDSAPQNDAEMMVSFSPRKCENDEITF